MHGPIGGPVARKESWRAICDFQAESGGLLRSIGISTFGIRHMKDILEEDEALPPPSVHQVSLIYPNFDFVSAEIRRCRLIYILSWSDPRLWISLESMAWSSR
jgi:diketogulonate reductase-like aldo/keto reductase